MYINIYIYVYKCIDICMSMSKSIYLCICMGRAAIAATCRTSQIFHCNLECLDCRCSSSTEKRFCFFVCLQEPCLCRPLESPRLYCTAPQRNLIWRIIVQDFEDIHCNLLWLFSYIGSADSQLKCWSLRQNKKIYIHIHIYIHICR